MHFKLPRLLPHSVLVAVVIAFLLVAVGYYSQQGRLLQLNRLIQDFAVASHGETPHDDIIIVAIDHASIEALGRWPWRRAIHAELLNRIGEGHPRAIGLDVLFIEEDQNHPQDDTLLAASLRRNAPVVLPVFIQQKASEGWAMLPRQELAESAAGLGQAHVKVDSDGIVRSIYRALPAQGQLWSPFAIEIIKAAHDVEHHQDHVPFVAPKTSEDGSDAIIIPFAGGPGYFSRISYADVLHGKVPAERFKDKYVLVGATAEGMADLYATPTMGEARMMPGVEVLANVIDSILHGRSIKTVLPSLNATLNLSFVLLTLTGLIFLQPLRALLFTLGSGLALLSITYFGIGMGWMLNPAAGVIGIVAAYVLWSWNRLDTAVRFLTAEFETLQRQGIATVTAEKGPRLHDFLGRRITALETATTQLRLLHRFVIDAINTVPYPIFVADLEGIILLANDAAARHLQLTSASELHGNPLHLLTHDLVSTASGRNVIPNSLPRDWIADFTDEARDHMGRDLIVKCTPISGTDQRVTGWMLSLVDISGLRQAERAREEAFKFIAHDIRAPLSAIIATLELQRLQPDNSELATRISQHAEAALVLADDVLNLSRAESGKLSVELVDLADLLREAAEESWTIGKTADIRFVISGAKEAYVWLDRHLCKRALLNLLSNAVKFSPPHTEVLCQLHKCEDFWQISIKDKGLGFDLERLGDLFLPFKRLHANSHPEIQGTGLGLAFVQVVARRHGGWVKAESQPGKGSTFYLAIPAGQADPVQSVLSATTGVLL